MPDDGPPGRLLRQVIELPAFYGPVPPTDPFALFVWETLRKEGDPRRPRRGTGRPSPRSRADAGRCPACAASDARSRRGACRFIRRPASRRAARRRRVVPPSPRAASRDSWTPHRRPALAAAAAATRLGRRASNAAVRREPPGDASRCARAAGRPASRLRGAAARAGSACSSGSGLGVARRSQCLPDRVVPVPSRRADVHGARPSLPGVPACSRLSIGPGHRTGKSPI